MQDYSPEFDPLQNLDEYLEMMQDVATTLKERPDFRLSLLNEYEDIYLTPDDRETNEILLEGLTPMNATYLFTLKKEQDNLKLEVIERVTSTIKDEEEPDNLIGLAHVLLRDNGDMVLAWQFDPDKLAEFSHILSQAQSRSPSFS